MTTIFTIARLRRRPAEHVGATATSTVQGARPDRYIPKHRDPRTADWKPAHTPGRHRAQHVRPEGQRPDLRIEQTQPLDLARLNEIVAGGAL